MNDSADNSLIPNDLSLSLPDIYETHDGRGRKMRVKSPLKKKVVSENENLFIYKDFDTSLTKVKGNIKKLPVIGQTTSKRGEDLIRDRLLSFNVKNGQLSNFDSSKSTGERTMIERSADLHRRKISESHAQLLKHKPKLSLNARHKAFWVQNQSETALPAIPQMVDRSKLGRSQKVTSEKKERNNTQED